MKLAIFFLVVVFLVSATYALPSYYNYVNDYADAIGDTTEAQINEYIALLERNTTSELAVLVVNDIENYQSEKEYVVAVFNEWSVGKTETDNGVLVLVVMSTRRIEIEVGYGLEGVLPDGKVGSIIRENADYFRAENYSTGIYSIVRALGSEIKQEPFQRSSDSYFIFPLILIVFFLAIFVISIAYSLRSNRCPKCKAQLKTRVREAKNEYIIEKYCEKCGFKKTTRKKRTGFFFFPVVVGGGSGGGGFGGFGGGSSGGGGAGGNW